MKYSLTLYALEPSVEDFDQAIRQDALDSPEMAIHQIVGDLDFDARLYSFHVDPTPPTWADLLAPGFPAYEAPPSAMAKVALVIRVGDAAGAFFAATFGSGRFLLRSDAYRPGYGLKVALNSIYEGDTPAKPVPSDRLRVVQSTSVGKNTMRTLKQANRNAAFQDFGVDLQRDQLGRVVGAPRSTDRWGSRITGSDAVRVRVIERIAELGKLCLDLSGLHGREDFKMRFRAIDDVRTVPEEDTPALEQRLLEILEQETERVNLSPAELLDWDDVSVFRFSLDGSTFEELGYPDIQPALLAEGLSLELLETEQVDCLDDQGETIAKWTLFEALDVELDVGDDTFLLVGGRFYSVAKDYLDDLHRYLDTIQESAAVLPASFVWQVNGKKVEETEGRYNERAAGAAEYELMDKKTVRLDRGGDPIEVCDLFSTTRQLIHVKRKFSSSSLSHLFGQGAVSGDLFLANPEFRQKFVDELDKPEQQPFRDLIPAGRPDSAAFEVVYAIIGPWQGQSLAERLPFFSKINLRRHAQDLETLGYRVTYSAIDLVPAPPDVKPPD